MDKFVNNKVGKIMEPWIETSTGEKFWFTSEDTNGIDIRDIAHCLSNACRFTGHCRFFYSVAEHSLNVAALLPEHKKLWGLLHDASEAYLADIASPVKQLLPDYKKLEARLMTRIATKFNLPDKFWEDEEVKFADWSQLKAEATTLLPSGGKDWYFPPHLKDGIPPLGYNHTAAKYLFLETFWGAS